MLELPFYEAKYKFESDEINITGIRKFNKNSEGYEIEFQASNLNCRHEFFIFV